MAACTTHEIYDHKEGLKAYTYYACSHACKQTRKLYRHLVCSSQLESVLSLYKVVDAGTAILSAEGSEVRHR